MSDASIVPMDAAEDLKITESISEIDATASSAYHSRPYASSASCHSGSWRTVSTRKVSPENWNPLNDGASHPRAGRTGALTAYETNAPTSSVNDAKSQS